MKKKIFLTIIPLFVFTIIVYSQKDVNVFLKGYPDNNYYKYFDSVHSLNKKAIQSLNHSYSFYVVFKIDSNASITDFEFIEIPEYQLPDIAKVYIRSLFYSTNGKWQQEIIKGRAVVSKDLLFSVSLLKSNQSIEERLKDFDKVFEFALRGLKLEKRMKGYNILNEKAITLTF